MFSWKMQAIPVSYNLNLLHDCICSPLPGSILWSNGGIEIIWVYRFMEVLHAFSDARYNLRVGDGRCISCLALRFSELLQRHVYVCICTYYVKPFPGRLSTMPILPTLNPTIRWWCLYGLMSTRCQGLNMGLRVRFPQMEWCPALRIISRWFGQNPKFETHPYDWCLVVGSHIDLHSTG